MKKNNINYSIKNNFACLEVNTFNCYANTKKTPIIWFILAGLGIGFVNGFWGGGGGMICVPVLTSLIKLPEKVGHATTLLIMLPLSIASLVVYFFGDGLDFNLAWQVGIGFVVGGVLGALLLKKINNITLKLIFALIIIAGGIKLLI